MIAARPSPALKPERPGVLVGVTLAADLAEGHPLRLADAIPAVQRCQSDELQLTAAAPVWPIGATSTQAPGDAGGGTGGSQT